MAANGNGDDVPPPGGGDLPVPDLQTMEELCQPTLNGRGGRIALVLIQATNFGLKNDMIQQVQNSCQFHGLSGDDANKHLDKFLHVTQSIKVNGVTDDVLHLWNLYQKASEECYDLIENMTTHHNDWDTSVQRSESSSSTTSSFDPKIIALKDEMAEINKKLMKMNTASSSGSGTLLSNTITNPKEDFKGITTRSGNAYKGPTISTTTSHPKVVERETEVTKDMTVRFLDWSGSPKMSLKVGTFHFLADFVVVDFDADPLVPLILGRSFLMTGRALIDVYEGESTLRVGKEVVTFNLDQTARYSSNDDAMSVNRIDLIDIACEEYSQEVLGFSVSGNPTLSTKPIVSNSSHTLTPFGDNDFLLEEIDAFLAIDDEPISPEIDDSYYDSEGYIILLEEFLNDDPSSPPLSPQELKVVKPNNEKSSINEPLVVELKDLPSHLEYAFLESDNKLPIIIAKDLKDEEKTTLIKVLKSHKQALAWQLTDIKGIDPEFFTHKILRG
nr:DNA-directed DNA polymerase [Tanacetum cinerariifolium]